MKPPKLYLKAVAVALAFSFGLSAYAETPREELVHAYYLLKKADHDYDGHRGKAMAEVETAGHEDRDRVASHVDEAVKEIDIALKIK
jgi:hypothetical protein